MSELWPSPFKIHGPAKISFSGGRTSAMMLKCIWDVGVDDDVKVVFANTGKEREETLVFVDQCAKRWNIPVVWLERDDSEIGYRVVTFETASRDGRPFAELIEERNYLPNPVTRFCTEELKIRIMKKWMVNHGYDHWVDVIGLRADEPKRVARMRASGRDIALPMAEAGFYVGDVDLFWENDKQGFDLGLKKWEGNCDLCFLKGRAKRTRVMRDKPNSPLWWIAQEQKVRVPRTTKEPVIKVIEFEEEDDAPQPTLPFDAAYMNRTILPKAPRERSHPFRIDAPSYADLYTISQQPMLDFDPAELEGEAIDDIGDCFCNAA